MLAKISGAFLGLALFTHAASAACTPYNYSFMNGQTADATQVNGNFQNILTCVNNILAGPSLAGGIGIGTAAAPSGPLYLNILASGNAGTQVKGTGYAYENLNTTNSSGVWGLADGGQMYFTVYSNIPLVFSTNSAERLRVTGAGNVGIGTTTPSSLLYVNGTAGGTQAWNGTSDARLKKNIQPIKNALNVLERLQGVRYDWRPVSERVVGKDLDLPVGQRQIGFIAQEVEAVVPEAVTVPKSKTDGVYSLADTKLIPILVEAVKEQQTEIEQLRNRIDELKSVNTHAMKTPEKPIKLTQAGGKVSN